MKNQTYKLDESQECVKQETLAECQLSCKQTAGCSQFSYFTKEFKGSNDVYGGERRMDCCLVMEIKSIGNALVNKQNVISGPTSCVTEKNRLTEKSAAIRAEKDIFSGKIMKLKISNPH